MLREGVCALAGQNSPRESDLSPHLGRLLGSGMTFPTLCRLEGRIAAHSLFTAHGRADSNGQRLEGGSKEGCSRKAGW